MMLAAVVVSLVSLVALNINSCSKGESHDWSTIPKDRQQSRWLLHLPMPRRFLREMSILCLIESVWKDCVYLGGSIYYMCLSAWLDGCLPAPYPMCMQGICRLSTHYETSTMNILHLRPIGPISPKA